MKKIFTLAVFAFLTATAFGRTLIVSETTPCSEEKQELNINIIRINTQDKERSIFNYPIIEAYLCPETHKIEVSLYNVGTATIGITDAWNHVFDYDIIDTSDCMTTAYLSTSGLHGTYYIVIYSDCCYAEGIFTI